MIEINYSKEQELIFDLGFSWLKYIPKSFSVEYLEKTDYHFIHNILISDPLIRFLGGISMIWSTHYRYKYKDMGFTLVFDEDYEFINNFAVDNPSKRKEIAEHIVSLIEGYSVKN
jgi:hypothetical protein